MAGFCAELTFRVQVNHCVRPCLKVLCCVTHAFEFEAGTWTSVVHMMPNTLISSQRTMTMLRPLRFV